MKGSLLSVLAAGFVLATASAARADVKVDLELVLAVDVSRSMDPEEQQLQLDGYVSAFRHPDIVAAIASGPLGRIAVTYVEWAGPESQTIVVPWTLVDGEATARSFAAHLSGGRVSGRFGTSISSMLLFSSGLFDANEFSGDRLAIDVSGDGPNNSGVPVAPVRDLVVQRGITINGLPIMVRTTPGFEAYGIPDLDAYYRDCVIGGPGAFMVVVDKPENFEVAIRRKLMQEIAARPVPVILAAEVQAAGPRFDCLAGENDRGRYSR